MTKYFYRNRPGGIGCQPDGWTAMESQVPKREVKAAWMLEGWSMAAFGYVEYAEPLPTEQAYRYDLVPDEPVEWAALGVYTQCGQDWARVARYLEGARFWASAEADNIDERQAYILIDAMDAGKWPEEIAGAAC